MALGEVLDYGLEQRAHPTFDAEAPCLRNETQ